MMNLAMNFDTDECSVTAMFDKGNYQTLPLLNIRLYQSSLPDSS